MVTPIISKLLPHLFRTLFSTDFCLETCEIAIVFICREDFLSSEALHEESL